MIPSPTIFRSGRWEVAAVVKDGKKLIAVREDPFFPWSLIGQAVDLYVLSTALSVIGAKWTKIVRGESIPELTDIVTLDTRVKGHDKPSPVINSTLPRDMFVGLGSDITTLRVPTLDDANDLAKVFQDLVSNPHKFEAMVPVDTNMSVLPRTRNYGWA